MVAGRPPGCRDRAVGRSGWLTAPDANRWAARGRPAAGETARPRSTCPHDGSVASGRRHPGLPSPAQRAGAQFLRRPDPGHAPIRHPGGTMRRTTRVMLSAAVTGGFALLSAATWCATTPPVCSPTRRSPCSSTGAATTPRTRARTCWPIRPAPAPRTCGTRSTPPAAPTASRRPAPASGPSTSAPASPASAASCTSRRTASAVTSARCARGTPAVPRSAATPPPGS